MHFSLKKFFFTVTFSTLASSGHVYSEYTESCNPISNWYASEDFLYWETCGQGMMYGTKSTLEVMDAAAPIRHHNSKIKNIHRRADIGYRLGVGYRNPCACWDAAVYWTYFVNDAHGHYAKPSTFARWFTPAFGGVTVNDQLLGGPLPTGIGTSGFPVQYASAHWKLRLNMIDGIVGREYGITSCLTLKPYIGLRAAMIDQRFDVKYVANTVENGREFSLVLGQPIDKITMKSDFEGVGPRIGMDASYDLGCGISLYGESAASLLWGMQEIETKENYSLIRPLTSEFFKLNQKDHESGCRALTDLALGIRWRYWCCRKEIIFQLGYEQHMFFNEDSFEKFTNFNAGGNEATDRYPQITRGNLCIHGLIASTKINF